ncbi:MotA/TolQ/ExbB proton channel family protein [Shewanella algae]|uniref:MotA/TolQ/ExbB proton channel family protein n=1 Tax=Shewanella algae TaxID=38313 RepID=UPI001BF09941|nr:MotA/TolQ/ExbB proton channel family protein [Shewanella algae]BCV55287.1 flagellar motor protein MotA [Shewanella algae]
MELSLYQSLHQQLGDLTWPLLICAFLTLMILLERFAILLPSLFRRQSWLGELRSGTLDESCDSLLERLKDNRGLISCGARHLLRQAAQPKALREELLSLWLAKEKRKLHAGLKLLQYIGAISPLLGLLGTVLGLLEMFNDIGANQSDSITPALLASGLGLAMYTTAAGLLIAVPALLGAQLFGLWAERSVASCAHALNQLNLWLEGVPLQGEDNDYAAFNLTKLSQINGKRRHPEPLS